MLPALLFMVLKDIANLDRDIDVRRDTVSDHAQRWPNSIIDRDHRSIKLAAHTQVQVRHLGTPQGGPLSPLLANVLLDEVDKELEHRGHCFACVFQLIVDAISG